MSKTLSEILNRYSPTTEAEEIFHSADSESIALRADKQQRALEISAAFSHVIPKIKLYEVEEGIRRAYELNMVRICPRYPNAHFQKENIPDLLMETNRRGIVANGFFNRCDWKLTGGELEVFVPVAQSGVGLIYDAKTPKLMEEIIQNEFGDSISVKISSMDDDTLMAYQQNVRDQLAELGKEAAKAEKEYERVQHVQESREFGGSAPIADEKEMLPRVATIYGEVAIPDVKDGMCRIGHYTFDISAPEFVMGDPFEITPTAIGLIDRPQRNIVILAEVTSFTKEEARTEGKFDISIDFFDGNASIEHRAFSVDGDVAGELAGIFAPGTKRLSIWAEKRGNSQTPMLSFLQ